MELKELGLIFRELSYARITDERFSWCCRQLVVYTTRPFKHDSVLHYVNMGRMMTTYTMSRTDFELLADVIDAGIVSEPFYWHWQDLIFTSESDAVAFRMYIDARFPENG